MLAVEAFFISPSVRAVVLGPAGLFFLALLLLAPAVILKLQRECGWVLSFFGLQSQFQRDIAVLQNPLVVGPIQASASFGVIYNESLPHRCSGADTTNLQGTAETIEIVIICKQAAPCEELPKPTRPVVARNSPARPPDR